MKKIITMLLLFSISTINNNAKKTNIKKHIVKKKRYIRSKLSKISRIRIRKRKANNARLYAMLYNLENNLKSEIGVLKAHINSIPNVKDNSLHAGLNGNFITDLLPILKPYFNDNILPLIKQYMNDDNKIQERKNTIKSSLESSPANWAPGYIVNLGTPNDSSGLHSRLLGIENDIASLGTPSDISGIYPLITKLGTYNDMSGLYPIIGANTDDGTNNTLFGKIASVYPQISLMYPAIGTNTTGYPSLLDRIGYPRMAVDSTTDIITSIADMLYIPNAN